MRVRSRVVALVDIQGIGTACTCYGKCMAGAVITDGLRRSFLMMKKTSC